MSLGVLFPLNAARHCDEHPLNIVVILSNTLRAYISQSYCRNKDRCKSEALGPLQIGPRKSAICKAKPGTQPPSKRLRFLPLLGCYSWVYACMHVCILSVIITRY